MRVFATTFAAVLLTLTLQSSALAEIDKKLLAEGQQLDNQAAGLFMAGKYREAIPPMLKCTEIYVKVLGENHRWVGDNYSHLGTMYFNLKEYEPAEKYYKKAMAVFEKCGGSCQMSEAIKNYAQILRSTKRGAEADKLEKEFDAKCPTK